MEYINDDSLLFLGPGKAYLEIGPTSMQISAWGESPFDKEDFRQLSFIVTNHLKEITKEKDIFGQPWHNFERNQLSNYGKDLFDACRSTEDTSLTLMAGIAGLLSRLAIEGAAKIGAYKAFANNGGDIAILLGKQDSFNLGVMSSTKSKKINEIVKIEGEGKIRGVATSGFGGRSITLGIADSVTVFSKDPVIADACATIVANSSNIKSPNVKVVKAKYIDPATDIPELEAVIQVGELTESEIEKSMEQMYRCAEDQHQKGNIEQMVGFLKGKRIAFP